MKLIKADLHVHTEYSGDADLSLEELIKRAGELGLGAVAVTDHGTTAGALKLAARETSFKVIVGEEILTNEGEIIGLFLKETIPGGLTPEETIARIRRQGGLVCVPHPFDRYRSSAMQAEALHRISGLIDIVEVFNARTVPVQNLKLPPHFARSHKLLAGAGSDSHSASELGRAFVAIPDFTGPEDFKKAMAQAQIHGRRPSLTLYLRALWRRILKLFRRKG